MYGNPYAPYGGYNSYGGYGVQPQSPIKTNKVFVTSLEDALARPAEIGSEYIYLHQDKPLLYEVKTDMQGRKTYTVLELSQPQNKSQREEEKADISTITKEDFGALQAEILAKIEEQFKELKASTAKKSKEAVEQ